MDLKHRFRDRRLWRMAALGLVTGILSSQLYQLEPLWRELSVGVVFGVVMGACLFNFRLGQIERVVAFAVLTVGAWWLAEQATIRVFNAMEESDFLSWASLVGGIAGGLVGALLLVLASAVLFPWFRAPALWGVTIGVGGLFGALLALIDHVDTGLVLFPPWQAAMALCLALGFPRETAGADGSEPLGG